jgi:Abnormal spindle-like microcephaly-assoc'd, ASPM-SPD-2-Hydin
MKDGSAVAVRLLMWALAMISLAVFASSLHGEPPPTASCSTAVPGSWMNAGIPTQTAQFTATYDVTPGQNDLNGLVGFSLNPAVIYTNVAVITRFNLTGTIDARNGSAYAADAHVPYTAGLSYHFRLIINPATQHYSVYVTPPGGSEITLATNYAFRSEQSTITSLNNWAANSGYATESVCNMTIIPGSTSIITATPPGITTQPVSQSIVAGQTATFSVVASGTAPLNYQWKKNGTAISGAASSSYTTPAETTSDNGAQFTVAVTNSAGSITSSAATLTISSAPGTLSLSSSSLLFGTVTIGSSSALSTTLSNTGSSSVTVSNVVISGAGFNASGVSTGQIIGVGQAATLNVSFAPAATGAVTGNVTVASNASNSPAIISLAATGAAPQFTSLSWTPSTSAVIGYNVYRGTASGGPYTKLTPSVISTISYSDTGVQSGQTYYYVVTAVNSTNVESVYSNQVAALIP